MSWTGELRVCNGADRLKPVAGEAAVVQVFRPGRGPAAAGEAGVHRVLDLLRAEFELAMALCGCPTAGSVTRAHTARAGVPAE